MSKILNHVTAHEGDPSYQLMFLSEIDHHEVVWWAMQQRMYPIEWEGGPVYDEHTNKPIDGVWYCANIDDDGYEWHFINRNADAMLFKLQW